MEATLFQVSHWNNVVEWTETVFRSETVVWWKGYQLHSKQKHMRSSDKIIHFFKHSLYNYVMVQILNQAGMLKVHNRWQNIFNEKVATKHEGQKIPPVSNERCIYYKLMSDPTTFLQTRSSLLTQPLYCIASCPDFRVLLWCWTTFNLEQNCH